MTAPKELEKAHEEILQGLEQFLGYEPTKRKILPLNAIEQNPITLEETTKSKSLGEYHHQQKIIKLRKELYPFDKPSIIEQDPVYLDAKNLFKDKPIIFDKRLCFIVIGTHEYTHSEFHEKQKEDLKKTIKSYSIIKKGKIPFLSNIIQNHKINKQTSQIMDGINEAYSFWATDMIFDIKSVTPQRIQTYTTVYGSRTGETLEYFYTELHKISQKKGSQYVNQNLNKIVDSEYEQHLGNPLALKK